MKRMSYTNDLNYMMYANRLEFPTRCLVELLIKLSITTPDSIYKVRGFIDRQVQPKFEAYMDVFTKDGIND